MNKEAKKSAVFRCEYSEQNPVYCQQCGGHEHLCRKPLSDRWCEYANHLIAHGNDITALSMRTNLLAEMNAHASHTAAIREKAEALVAKLAISCDFCGCNESQHSSVNDIWSGCCDCRSGCDGFRLSDELTALKTALEKGNG